MLRESGIFCPTQHRDKLHMEKFLDTPQLRRWGLLLSQGLGPTVLEEALAYLDTLVETGEIDQRALRNFWIQFQQAALNAALAKEMDSHDLLQAIEQGVPTWWLPWQTPPRPPWTPPRPSSPPT